MRHAAGAHPPVRLLDEAIPFEPRHGFSTAALFHEVLAPQTLLSMFHYLGYLTVQYPKDEAQGDMVVAPNDQMRRGFTNAVLRSPPKAYRAWAFAAMAKKVPRAVAVKDALNAYLAGRLPK
eukprot:gene12745-9112_t